MQVRIPTNVLTTLKDVARGQGSNVSKMMSEAMERVAKGDLDINNPEDKVKISSTSIYVSDDLRKSFKHAVEEKGLKVEQAMRILAEMVISNTGH